ncbi:MAG TPA: hypothetical protein VHG89_12025 [Verrucomicrobiae bacterium]|nr:hypothetical protein [Verrucomicrobiae bacterium]
MANKIEHENFLEIVHAIRTRFPNLQTELKTENLRVIDAELTMPTQNGLSFPISIYLQNDELHLHAGNFWCEWFPSHKQEVCDKFVDIVCGLLSGSYRVVEYLRFGSVLKTQIQKPDGSNWELVAWSSRPHIPISWGMRTKIIQNINSV